MVERAADGEFESGRVMTGGASGHGPDGGGSEYRLAALERGLERLDAKLEAMNDLLREIGSRLTRIETELGHKASSEDLAAIKGRVDSLPTTWQMITLVFGILGGAFVILRFGLPHGP